MQFAEKVQLSTIDYPQQTCSVIYTLGCNLRCPYCHNIGLAKGTEPSVDLDKIIKKLKKNRKITDFVCITGGEPTLQNGLVPFVRFLRDEGFFVKLDTNGTRSDILKMLLDQNLLTYVAMDIKFHSNEHAQNFGTDEKYLEQVYKSIKLLYESSCQFELRTTPIRDVNSMEFFSTVSKLVDSLAKEYRHYAPWYINTTKPAYNVDERDILSEDELSEMIDIANSKCTGVRITVR
jgi:pyruvate formate lyase activating enzyme